MAKAAKPAKKGKILSPLWLTLAAVCGWGASHVPASMDVDSAGSWALEALAVGILVRAVLAFLSPLLGLSEALIVRLIETMPKKDEAS